ncbi:MAG TPA: hypothetical protein VMR37_04210 [Rhabdochlamydiaceae bacterium]|jgi:hypothetical protein|nr:hypothetical protein [Rhabdochlamydiaceae bacterium]
MSRYKGDHAHQAFRILQVVFVLLPIIAGLDKFFSYLTNWSDYLSPMAWQMIDGHADAFFMVVGVIEIIAGLGVLFKPRIFAYIVSAWLLLIVINLLILGGLYYDVALRDIGLMFSAFALGKLAQRYKA